MPVSRLIRLWRLSILWRADRGRSPLFKKIIDKTGLVETGNLVGRRDVYGVKTQAGRFNNP